MTVLLIDTYSVFFRAFHALPPMNTTSGEPTSGLYGLASLLLKLLREERPEGVAFALDRSEPTFRHELYADYKGTREPVPRDLASQFERLHELLDALAFPRFAVRGYEADDVLATLADELAAQGKHALIASGDRDMLQLIGPATDVLFLGQRGKPPKRYDLEAVQARFGVGPERLPLFVALVGDVSDNIPKLKGIGPVTATRIAARFGSAEALLSGLDTLEDAKLSSLLRAHADQLRASENLVRLRRDVALPEGVRFSQLSKQSIEATRKLFQTLEFKSLVPRLDVIEEQLRGRGGP